jgi:hypothetical protein
VMISSTARDLPEHREQVRLARERAGFEPREMMEHLTALDTDALDISLRMVDQADVYIGIFAYRYGYVPDGQDLSITEMEYDRAVAKQKPRLIFFMHGDHPVTRKDVETGAGATVRLDDVWDAVARGPYPLYQADAYNVLADLEWTAGNPQAAIDAATRAYQAAWCDGPPYAYHWGLQTATGHLTALGAPEPDMPAFDKVAFEPLPEVEINPPDEHWVDPATFD